MPASEVLHNKMLAPTEVRLDTRLWRRLCGAVEALVLAVSPALADLSAEEVVRDYARRRQIEESFRDLKDPPHGAAWRGGGVCWPGSSGRTSGCWRMLRPSVVQRHVPP